ncbi:MAG: 1-acyl-sn-glycerol-3-phosphate acyltransferase [Bacteroidales bacterium]
MKYISFFILRMIGWKVTNSLPAGIPKCVVIMAPHTSMWDFVLGRLGFFILDINVRFLIKKEMFFFPLGPLIKWLGGISVDRSKSTQTVDYIAGLFAKYDNLYFTITPEGTRKQVEHWKKGFYYIAQKANVPIALGFLDYSKKHGGIGPVIIPTGNFEEDFKMIESFYRGMGARHPEMFNLS